MLQQAAIVLIFVLSCLLNNVKVVDCVICQYYPYLPSSNLALNVSCKAECCRNFATRPYQACCENMSPLSVTYMIAFGLLLGCCTIFAIIGFIISCCKYGKCNLKRRRRSSLSSTTRNEPVVTSDTQITTIDLPPSYGDLVLKPAQNQSYFPSGNLDDDDKDRNVTPPPPYSTNRINVLPVQTANVSI